MKTEKQIITEQIKYLKKELIKTEEELKNKLLELDTDDIKDFIKFRIDQLKENTLNYRDDVDNHFSYEFIKSDLDKLENIYFYMCQVNNIKYSLMELEEKC